MKNITNYNDKPLQKEQYKVLVEVIYELKTLEDLSYLLENFVTESERVYLGQRLNIMRMLAKGFSYSKIKDKLGVPTSTISGANKMLERGGNKLKKLILSYRFKPEENDYHSKTKPLVNLHYPGAIKL